MGGSRFGAVWRSELLRLLGLWVGDSRSSSSHGSSRTLERALAPSASEPPRTGPALQPVNLKLPLGLRMTVIYSLRHRPCLQHITSLTPHNHRGLTCCPSLVVRMFRCYICLSLHARCFPEFLSKMQNLQSRFIRQQVSLASVSKGPRLAPQRSHLIALPLLGFETSTPFLWALTLSK